MRSPCPEASRNLSVLQQPSQAEGIWRKRVQRWGRGGREKSREGFGGGADDEGTQEQLASAKAGLRLRLRLRLRQAAVVAVLHYMPAAHSQRAPPPPPPRLSHTQTSTRAAAVTRASSSLSAPTISDRARGVLRGAG
eukprot:3358686-Rhodomonas_salina.1